MRSRGRPPCRHSPAAPPPHVHSARRLAARMRGRGRQPLCAPRATPYSAAAAAMRGGCRLRTQDPHHASEGYVHQRLRRPGAARIYLPFTRVIRKEGARAAWSQSTRCRRWRALGGSCTRARAHHTRLTAILTTGKCTPSGTRSLGPSMWRRPTRRRSKRSGTLRSSMPPMSSESFTTQRAATRPSSGARPTATGGG